MNAPLDEDTRLRNLDNLALINAQLRRDLAALGHENAQLTDWVDHRQARLDLIDEVLTEAEEGAYATASRDFGRGVGHIATKIRMAMNEEL